MGFWRNSDLFKKKHFSSLKLTELEHLGKSLKIKKENLWKGHCEVVFESETISGNGSLVLARTIVDILWEARTAVNFILKKYFTMTLLSAIGQGTSKPPPSDLDVNWNSNAIVK